MGDIETVKALREAVGYDMKLMVDVQWMYDVPTAIIARAVDAAVESPCKTTISDGIICLQ